MLNIIRGFSFSSVARYLIRPPVHVFGIEGSYAIALYSAATKLKQLDSIEKDFETVKNELKTDTKLKEMFDNPLGKLSEKVEAIKNMATKVKLTSALTNLLILLAENNRLQRLEKVASSFSTIMAGSKGRLLCYVTTAKLLDKEEKEQLEKILSAYAKKGEKIVVNFKVDPSLIGGMIVSAGDKHIDMSVATKMRKYTDIMKTTLAQGASSSSTPQDGDGGGKENKDCEEPKNKKS